MSHKLLRLGLVGAVHPNMPGDDAGLFEKILQTMEVGQSEWGYELVSHTEPLRNEDDAEKAREIMDAAEVDMMLLFMPSLPVGRVILPLAKARSRIGLWSVGEPTKNGVLQLNSFCGLNMLGSIIGNYLRQHEIPFKWFYGMPSDELFKERFAVTLAALRAIKALKKSRIGQIGGLANGFENLYFDERSLEKRFGTFVQTRHTVEEIVARARVVDDSRVGLELKKMGDEGSINPKTVSTTHLDKAARLFVALEDFAAEHRYQALAISCWSRFQEIYGVAVCSAMSRLNNSGTVATCEGDVPAALNMLMFNAMHGGHASLHDLVSFDESDSTVNIWHCGVCPGCWADSSGVVWDSHFNIGRYEGSEWKGDGVVADMTFKASPITLCTMDSHFENLFILSGEIAEDKRGYSGSSGWVGNIHLNGEPTDLRDLMNTISVMRVNHHYPAALGELTNELNEFAAWMGMGVIDKVPYRPYMQNKQKVRLP
jgi:L-fucose isomerase-like protein